MRVKILKYLKGFLIIATQLVIFLSCVKDEKLSAAIIAGPSVNFLTPTKVQITWETDIPGNSTVEYGLDTSLDSIYVDNEERQSHNVILSGLSFNKTYYYRISSISSSFDTEVSGEINSFTTGGNIINIVTGPIVELITPSEVLISWDTDTLGNSIVEYGMNTNLDSSYIDDEEGKFHSVTITNLYPDLKYFYRITSVSSALNAQVSSAIDTFTTLEGVISIISPPVVEHTSPVEVQITWDTDVTGSSIVNYGLTTDLGSQVLDSEEQLSHSITLMDLAPDTPYYYRVTSISSGLNAQASSAIDTFTTIEGVISILSPPVVENISPVEVQITWDTDITGNSIVDYGLTTDLGSQILDSEEQLSHSINLTDLTPGTLYYYEVTSVSSALNAQVSSAIDTFTTDAGVISIISPPVVEHTSPVEVQIIWDTDITGNSIVDYGLTTDLGSQVMDSEEQLLHSINLTDLTPSTTYYYQVTSISSALNAYASSVIDSFTTSTGELNIVMGPEVEIVSSTEVLITWDTDIISNSIIDYSTTTNLDSQVIDLTEQLSHSMTLTNLTDSTTYYYQVTSVSSALNVQVSSEIDTFATSGLMGR